MSNTTSKNDAELIKGKMPRGTRNRSCLITEEQSTIIGETKDRVAANLKRCIDAEFGSQAAAVDALSGCISSESAMSRLVNAEQCVSLELLAALRLVCGIDLNEFVVGENTPPNRVTLDQISQKLDELITMIKLGNTQ